MKMFGLAILLVATSTLGQDLWQRDLVRARVVDCVSNVPSVITVVINQIDSGNGPVTPGFEVQGDVKPGAACVTSDNYIGDFASGTLVEFRNQWSLGAVLYTAEIVSGTTTYKIADYAKMTPVTSNGARYRAVSQVLLTDSGKPVQYYIDYMRRQQQGVADVPASIMQIQREVDGSMLLFTLDYRDPAGS